MNKEQLVEAIKDINARLSKVWEQIDQYKANTDIVLHGLYEEIADLEATLEDLENDLSELNDSI